MDKPENLINVIIAIVSHNQEDNVVTMRRY